MNVKIFGLVIQAPKSSNSSFPYAWVTTGIFFVLVGVLHIITISPDDFDFGYEYGWIASSIAQGQGYANVFWSDSGPTAWMLPLNTLLYAAVFALFGVKTLASLWVIVFLNCLFWSASAYYLFQAASVVSETLAFLAVVILFGLLVLLKSAVINGIADNALLNMLSIATVYFLYKYFRYHTGYRQLLLLAFVLPLTSPGLFLAFALALIGRFCYLSIYKSREYLIPSKHFFYLSPLVKIVYIGLVSILAISVWSYRNFQEFNRFIPSKSNFWYEFYQANMADEDGILNQRTIQTFHPNAKGKYYALYDSLGEIKFLDTMKLMSQQEFDRNDYLKRVGQRLQFSFLWCKNTYFRYPADTAAFSLADQQLLHREGLIRYGNWIALDLDSTDFTNKLNKIPLERRSSVWTDWNSKKRIYWKSKRDVGTLLREGSISLLPFLCIVLGLAIGTVRRNPLFQLVVFTYIIQLLPYILVSHYNRYQQYLLSQQAFLIFVMASYVLTQFKLRRKIKG